MKCFLIAFISLLLSPLLQAQQPTTMLSPKEVLVVFNNKIKESAELAHFYAKERGIDPMQVVGLPLSEKAAITRAEYNKDLLLPLRDIFEKRNWWVRQLQDQNVLIPVQNSIRAIVLMKGVPLIITHDAALPFPETMEHHIINDRNDAAVDQELALLGVDPYPLYGVLSNHYYQAKAGILESNLPFIMLVTRLDAATFQTCKRMVRDAIDIEKKGLRGITYLDLSFKYPEGDQWLNQIEQQNSTKGMPTVKDQMPETFCEHYPMSQAAMYFGWYAANADGPFADNDFHFNQGAVAAHIHSFSAAQMQNPDQNWSAALLELGAAATVGNVNEPFLSATHHLDLLHRYLLEGYTLAEASWAALPTYSWQSVCFGDPLYRPFLQKKPIGDDAFSQARTLALEQANNQSAYQEALKQSALKQQNAWLAEVLALSYKENNRMDLARDWFSKARDWHLTKSDKIRQELHLIALLREQKNNHADLQALEQIRIAKKRYWFTPSLKALDKWEDILKAKMKS